MDTAPWNRLQAEAAALGLPLDDAQRDAIARFHALLVEANRTTNLTRIVDDGEAAIKHYLDSLIFLRGIPEGWHAKPIKLIDVGAGAGLPGIPLAIVRPHWRIAMLDTVSKKTAFIAGACEALGLENARSIHARAEDLASGAPHRDAYDVVTARALANMPELLELCLPFAKPDGRLVISKGSKGPEELIAAKKAMEVLRAAPLAEERLELPDDAGERHLYVIGKHGRTPAGYPRKAGIPHRKPIC